jgi:long-chain acyl-CoA synthetase
MSAAPEEKPKFVRRPPTEIEVWYQKSSKVIPRLFRDAAKRYKNRDALGAKNAAGVYEYFSYEELDRRVQALAAYLVESGVARHDHLGILAENRPAWTIADLGSMTAGGVVVPIYPTLTAIQVKYILSHCDAKAVIVSNQEQYEKVASLFDQVPTLTLVIACDEVRVVAHDRVRTVSMATAIEEGKGKVADHRVEIEKRLESIECNDVCSIIYTSGTTGNPKGVMLTHLNFLSNANDGIHSQIADLIREGKQVRELSFLPLAHCFERVTYYALIIFAGGTIAYAESIDLLVKNLSEVKPTTVVSVPRVYEKVYARVMGEVAKKSPFAQKVFHWSIKAGRQYYEAKKAKNVGLLVQFFHAIASRLVFKNIQEKFGGNVVSLLSGGAPLGRHLAEFFCSVGLPISEGYGLTETSPIITTNRPTRIEFGTVGQVLRGVDVKIAEDGEILARGPNIMKGYYKEPEATAATIDADGWLHTGDLGSLDDQHFLRITGRKKEIIVMSNGKNVAPDPVERVLMECALVERAVIVGDNKPFICALIIPNFDSLKAKGSALGLEGDDPKKWLADPKVIELYEKELAAIGDGRLAKFEVPKKFSLLSRDFTIEDNELTPTLKVKRRIVSQRYAAKIDKMYYEK